MLYESNLRDITIDQPESFQHMPMVNQTPWQWQSTPIQVQQMPGYPGAWAAAPGQMQPPTGYMPAQPPQESVNPVQRQRQLRAVNSPTSGPVSELATGAIINAGFTE